MNQENYVVYGPPGTGKSTEIVRRVKHYINGGYSANDIALCSYTKAAAEVLSDKSGINSDYIGTIHSLAFRLCDLSKSQIVNMTKLREFQEKTGIEFLGGNPDDCAHDLLPGDYYLSLYNLSKAKMQTNHMQVYDESDHPGSRDEYMYFVDAYEKWKNSTGFIDYNDMLHIALEDSKLPVEILFVDEAQDLSLLQWKLIEHWGKDISIVYIAGDDDQAIYDWAGAKLDGMQLYEKQNNATRIVLDKSYRLSKKIHNCSQSLISLVNNRVNKEYEARSEEGQINYYGDVYELQNIKHGDDIMFLYRNHTFRDAIEEYLISRFIPYTVDNGKPGPCQGSLWKLIKLFIKVQDEGANNIQLTARQISMIEKGLYGIYGIHMCTPKMAGIFKLQWHEAIEMSEEQKQYFMRISEIDPSFNIKPTIHLSTIHGAKGKEADRVILINGMTEKSAEQYFSGNVDGEIRVFYVGVTRAKNRLDIISDQNMIPEL